MLDSEKLIYKRAIDLYGPVFQIHMCSEEMSELNKELMKSLRNGLVDDNTTSIVDELADVLVMVEQMMMLYDVEQAVLDRKRFKLSRLITRMDLTQKHSED